MARLHKTSVFVCGHCCLHCGRHWCDSWPSFL